MSLILKLEHRVVFATDERPSQIRRKTEEKLEAIRASALQLCGSVGYGQEFEKDLTASLDMIQQKKIRLALTTPDPIEAEHVFSLGGRNFRSRTVIQELEADRERLITFTFEE